METLNCRSCGLCNHKGKPSVTKYSKYCDTVRGSLTKKITTSISETIWDRINSALQMKGLMRRLGKPKKDDEEDADKIPDA